MNILTPETLRAKLAANPRQSLDIPGYQRAAVLVPLLVSTSDSELLFTLRTHTVETHKGQISFPGGVVDDGDRDIIHTALRETEEEIGLDHSLVDVVGVLDDLPTPTSFVITPVVGVIRTMPELTVNPHEVAEVFCAPLSFFSNRSNARTELRTIRGREREVWFYDYGDKVIWGATAMMVRTLLARLGLS